MKPCAGTRRGGGFLRAFWCDFTSNQSCVLAKSSIIPLNVKKGNKKKLHSGVKLLPQADSFGGATGDVRMGKWKKKKVVIVNQKYSCNLHLKAESGLCKPWPCQGTCTLLERSVRTPPSEWWGCSSAATELLHRAGLRGLSWRGTQRADSVCTGICHCASPVTCCKEPEPARVLLLALTPGAGTCLGAALGCQGAGCGVIGNLPRGKS